MNGSYRKCLKGYSSLGYALTFMIGGGLISKTLRDPENEAAAELIYRGIIPVIGARLQVGGQEHRCAAKTQESTQQKML